MRALATLGYDLVPQHTLVPEKPSKGRFLQISVRLHGSRQDKPHDQWYVVQIVAQTHRGENFVPGSNQWVFADCPKCKEVRMISHSASSGLGSPRIYSDPTHGRVPFTFITRNTMGRLDDMPMIIDYQEMEAIGAAVVAYNEKFGNTGCRDQIVGGMEIM